MDNTDFLLSKFSYIFSKPMQAFLHNDSELTSKKDGNKSLDVDSDIKSSDDIRSNNE